MWYLRKIPIIPLTERVTNETILNRTKEKRELWKRIQFKEMRLYIMVES